MAEIVLVGTNHRVAPVEWRERMALAPSEIPDALVRLHADLCETAILSTCNRFEIYAVEDDEAKARRVIAAYLQERGATPAEMIQYLYRHTGEAAVRHLISVAAGLDSMLVGEAQILGQVGDAHAIAHQAGTLGAILSRLLQEAVNAGKAARTQTEIGRGAVSLGHAAAELARTILDRDAAHEMLVIGAGQIAGQVARGLHANGIGPILVANRTFERARELAEQFGGSAIRFDRIDDALERVDIVIASSAAPHVVISREQVGEAMRCRNGRPLCLIDIAVPRDVDPDVAQVPGVKLFNIDDLRDVCDVNLAHRQAEADKVEAIVEAKTRQFVEWLAERGGASTISALYRKAETLRQHELARARRHLGDLTPEQNAAVDKLTRSLVNKLLHDPVLHLRRPGNGRDRAAYLAISSELFGLDADQSSSEGTSDADGT